MKLLPRNRWRLLAALALLGLIAAGWMTVRPMPDLPSKGTFSVPEVGAEPLTYSPDGNRLLVGAGAKKAYLLDTKSGNVIRTLDLPHLGRACVFAPDGRTFAYGGWSSSVSAGVIHRALQVREDLTIRDAADGHVLAQVPDTSDWFNFRYSDDGKALVAVLLADLGKRSAHVVVVSVDASSGEVLKRLALPQGGLPAITPDGRHLVRTAGTGLELDELQTGRVLLKLATGDRAPTRPFGNLVLSADGSRVAGARSDGAIFVWNLRTGQLVSKLDVGSGRGTQVEDLNFSADGATLVAAYRIRLPTLTIPVPGPVARLFPPAGSAPPPADHAVVVWDVASGRIRSSLDGPQAEVTGMAISPDGRTLATGDRSKQIRLWDLGAGR